MRNTIQKYGRLTALFLAVTLCVSGCGSSGESSLNYRPQMQTGTVVASGGAYSLDYLSQDICVIPKNKQSKEGSDSVMTAGASMIRSKRCYFPKIFMIECIRQALLRLLQHLLL